MFIDTIVSKSVLLTSYRVQKCLIDSLSVLFEVDFGASGITLTDIVVDGGGQPATLWTGNEPDGLYTEALRGAVGRVALPRPPIAATTGHAGNPPGPVSAFPRRRLAWAA